MAAGYPNQGVMGPRIVGHMLAYKVNELIYRFTELGFSFDGDGAASVNPELGPVVDAVFHVLAGGEVEIKIKHRGNPDIVAELQRRLADGMAEANEINSDAGFYITAPG